MVKNYPALKKLAPIIFLLFSLTAFSQISGDFRSKGAGPSDWEAPASWQTYNGTTWVDATTYPGENTGTYTVTIQTGHTISILTNLKTAPMGSVIVNGTLNLVAPKPNSHTFPVTLETMSLTISGTGLINFDGAKISLILPGSAFVEILDGGDIVGDCNNNVEISIGNEQFAVCKGTGNSYIATFVELVAAGGTINANITAPSSNPTIICGVQSTTLEGSYSGIVGTAVIYEWKVKDPNNTEVVIPNPSSPSTSFTPPLPLIPGNYLVSFKVTSSLSGTPFSNIETKTITVKALPVAAGTITGTSTVCQGQNAVTYTVPAIANATSYIWNLPSGASGTSTTNSITVNYGISSVSGNITVRGTNTCGSGSVSENYVITVNPLPATPGAITVTSAQCPSLTNKVYSISKVTDATTYNWTVPLGWSITAGSGTTSITVSTGSAGQNGNITVSAQNFCASTVQTLAVTGNTINYWNGTNTDWNNAANWSNGVPGGSNELDIVIPVVSSGKYPLLSDDISIKNIEIQDGALLNVLNNGLTITGVLILNGRIDLQEESQLVQEKTSSLIVCNNSSGSIEIDQQGTGNSFRYNYWSSPVNSRGTKFKIDEVLRAGDGTGTLTNKNITYGGAFAFADGAVTPQIKLSTYWMYVLRNSNKGYAAWFHVGNTGDVLVGEGYTMKGSNTSAAEQNYTFVGKPNNGDITLPINAGFDYLAGNPYPSAIDANQFLLDNSTSITGAIYFWEHYGGDTHNLAGYQGGYATRNLIEGVPATSAVGVSSIVPPGLVKKIPGPYIAVGQAFFVVGDFGGKIQFNNGQRFFEKESSGSSIFMKNSNTKAKTADNLSEDLRSKFRIGFDAPKISHRQILLGIDERASNGVDWGFDAEIYEIFADDMYWVLDNKKYVIQGTNAIGLNSEVPLGIQLSKTGVVTVKIDALENVDDDTSIYLKDKLTGESFNMKDKPVQLNLTAGKYTDRFVIVFKTQKLMAEDVKTEVLVPAVAQPIIEGIHVFMNNAMKELQIKNNSTYEILSVALINSLGQTVKTWNSNFKIRTISLPVNTETGVYLVQLNTKNGKVVKKIIIE